MATEVWWRNPAYYIRECLELHQSLLAWDLGFAKKKTWALGEMHKWADTQFPAQVNFRMLFVGKDGTAELRRGDTFKKPAAVYPTWRYGHESLTALEEMMQYNVGDDRTACTTAAVDRSERPVYGQEHRIIVTDMPQAASGPGRHIFRLLAELQEEHPDVILHIHRVYSYNILFGLGFPSVDVDPKRLAQAGRVQLPNGKMMVYEDTEGWKPWLLAVGYKPDDLSVPRVRCMANMKGALWAGQYWQEDFKFAVHGRQVDPQQEGLPALQETTSWKSFLFNQKRTGTLGDYWLCDQCSLQDTCKFYRVGSVCSVPGSEPSELAKMLGSRDANRILEGLSSLIQKQTERVEIAVADEEKTLDAGGSINPAVSKLIDALFDKGVKLAKLRNPKLTGASPQIINANIAAIAAAEPKQMAAAAVRELEKAGVAREDIKPEMIAGILGMAPEDVDEDVIDVEDAEEVVDEPAPA